MKADKTQTVILPHIIQMCSFELNVICAFPQIENIDTCLTFLAAKGVNIQGLSAEGKFTNNIFQKSFLFELSFTRKIGHISGNDWVTALQKSIW